MTLEQYSNWLNAGTFTPDKKHSVELISPKDVSIAEKSNLIVVAAGFKQHDLHMLGARCSPLGYYAYDGKLYVRWENGASMQLQWSDENFSWDISTDIEHYTFAMPYSSDKFKQPSIGLRVHSYGIIINAKDVRGTMTIRRF